MSGLLCSGLINVGLLNDDDSFAGFMPVKNTVKLEIANGDSNEKTRLSKMIPTYGAALSTVYTPGPSTLAIDVDDHDADIAGMAFRGAVAPVSVVAGSNQAATVTLAVGLYVPIKEGAYNLTNVVVKDPDDPTTTFTPNVDYILDAESGMIRKLAGGQAGETVDVTFSAAAYTALELTPNVKQTVNARIQGRLKNLDNGKDIFLTIPKVALYPSSPVDWLSSDFAVSSFGGPILSLDGQAPFKVRFIQ